MPLAEAAGNAAPDFRAAEIWRRAHGTLDELVQQTVFEAGEKWGSELVAGQQGVRAGFSWRATASEQVAGLRGGAGRDGTGPTFSVNEHVGAAAVGSHEHGLTIYLLIGPARQLDHGLEKLRDGAFSARVAAGIGAGACL